MKKGTAKQKRGFQDNYFGKKSSIDSFMEDILCLKQTTDHYYLFQVYIEKKKKGKKSGVPRHTVQIDFRD